MRVEFKSFTKWSDFAFNLFPFVYIMKDEIGVVFGFGIFCWAVIIYDDYIE